MRHMRIVCIILCIAAIALMSTQILAQGAPTDSDGDGLPDTVDKCPNEYGPRENGGCPWPTPVPEEPKQPDRIPGDYDGDGTRDEDDACPEDGGPDWNAGCPVGEGPPATTPEPVTLPDIPRDGRCLLATRGPDRVRVRTAPSLTADLAGVLDPTLTYPVLLKLETADETWFLTIPGWVAGWVVRLGGDCRLLPAVQRPSGRLMVGDFSFNFVPTQITLPDTLPDESNLTGDESSGPDSFFDLWTNLSGHAWMSGQSTLPPNEAGWSWVFGFNPPGEGMGWGWLPDDAAMPPDPLGTPVGWSWLAGGAVMPPDPLESPPAWSWLVGAMTFDGVDGESRVVLLFDGMPGDDTNARLGLILQGDLVKDDGEHGDGSALIGVGIIGAQGDVVGWSWVGEVAGLTGETQGASGPSGMPDTNTSMGIVIIEMPADPMGLMGGSVEWDPTEMPVGQAGAFMPWDPDDGGPKGITGAFEPWDPGNPPAGDTITFCPGSASPGAQVNCTTVEIGR